MGKAAQKQAPTFVSIKNCGSQWVAANKVAIQLGYKRPHGAVLQSCHTLQPGNSTVLEKQWNQRWDRYHGQSRYSQLQCGNTVNLNLFLLQSILAPSLHYGCEIWGMHTPRSEAQIALQCIYDRYLRHICGVKYATPSAMLREELGLSPLQVFWWRRTLEFWSKIAASPVRSLFHTILLDNLDDGFFVGNCASNFSGSIATSSCLQSVGSPCLLAEALSLSWRLVQFLKPCVSIWAAPMTMTCIVPE